MVDEMVRQGLLQEGGAAWETPGSLETMTVEAPETLRQFLEQQFAQLSPAEQDVLEVASVAGVEFSAAAVAAGVGQPVEHVEATCMALAHRGQFVQPRGTMAWPDGTVSSCYGFLHTLYQEILYERLTASRRARFHQQIGRRCEVGFGDQAAEIATELAVHFMRGRDPARSVSYLRLAAAQARHAYAAVETHLRQVLDLLPQLPDTPGRRQDELATYVALGAACTASSGFAAPETGHAYTHALALAQLAEAHLKAKQPEAARRVVEEALTVMAQTGECWYAAELHRLKGECLLLQAGTEPNRRAAEGSFRQALAIARRQQAKSWELRAALSLARLWQQQGKREATRALLAPIYGWFTEGFDTADLQEARALLAALA